MGIQKWMPRSIRRRSADWADFDLDDLFGDFFRSPLLLSQRMPRFESWLPDIDVSERKNEIVIRADLPGLEREELEVNVTDDALTLRGERRTNETVEEEDYYRSERWTGAFARVVPLPASVAAEKVEASFKNGVLEVHLPKNADAKQRHIEIHS